MRSRLLRAALATAALGLAAPTVANATLVYTQTKGKGSVWVADDDGSNARKLAGNAGLPQISPDGQTVAYVAHIISRHPAIVTKPTAGGPVTEVFSSWSYGSAKWSSDGQHLLAITGRNFRKPQRLTLFDVASGAKRKVAEAYFSGFDFSPAGDQIVYGAQPKQNTFPKTNLFIAPTAGGDTRQLTTDGKSLAPAWGPTTIAYTRYHRPTGKHKNEDGPKYNLFLIDPVTGLGRQLTHDNPKFLLAGLTPTFWSTDGTKLLADFNGQDTFYSVKVDPVSGEHTKVGSVGKFKLPIQVTAISDDGATLLGNSGYFDAFEGDLFTIPYDGSGRTRIVRHAVSADWTG
jgi:Tol biopolymer transport system component